VGDYADEGKHAAKHFCTVIGFEREAERPAKKITQKVLAKSKASCYYIKVPHCDHLMIP